MADCNAPALCLWSYALDKAAHVGETGPAEAQTTAPDSKKPTDWDWSEAEWTQAGFRNQVAGPQRSADPLLLHEGFNPLFKPPRNLEMPVRFDMSPRFAPGCLPEWPTGIEAVPSRQDRLDLGKICNRRYPGPLQHCVSFFHDRAVPDTPNVLARNLGDTVLSRMRF